MKVILLGITLILAVVGYGLYVTQHRELDDSKAIRKYIDTRGTSPLPRSWAGKIGEGI